MAQYQSFPDASGDSRTLEKLNVLKLPDLADRSFLDVGCNEGFFCGFAKFLGASRAVGIDHSSLFIERARRRFPDCEFHHQGWQTLPEGCFDVILLASALHYADDQPALLHRLVDKLSPDGVLVLELGIESSPESQWVRVKRGDDERDFPSMPKLQEILSGYAWKWMGRSVSQDGDPVPRHVVHVSRRRPAAYLLMQPPAYGKSSIASRLFVPAGVPIVSGDQEVGLIARGTRQTSERLHKIIAKDYSPFRIDQTLLRIFEAGAGEDLVRLWAAQAGAGDFALDVYVPEAHHELVERILADLGYLPVRLNWERVGPRLLPAKAIGERAEAFYMSMAAPGAPRPRIEAPDDQVVTGYLDELKIEEGRLTLRGWMVDATGKLPERLGVKLQGRILLVDDLEAQLRPDVQRHLKLAHASVGYRVTLEVPAGTTVHDLRSGFEVFVPAAGKLRLAARVAKQLRPNE